MDGASGIRVAPYSEAHAEGQRSLARRMWPAKERRRDPAYLRWKFRGPATGEVPGLLVALDGDAVVGQLGLIPVDLAVDGEVRPAQWACDLMVDDRVRRGGTGTRLLRAGMEGERITLGSEPSPAADVAMARAGFRPIPGPTKMVLPIDASHVLEWKLRGRTRPLARPLGTLAAPWVAWRLRRLARARPGLEAEPRGWREVVARVERREAAVERPHVVHDAAFLGWRARGLPGFSPELSALVVEEDGYALWEAAGSNLYVHDWHAASPEGTAALFRVLLEGARAAGSQTVRAMAQDAGEVARLRDLGFLAQRRPVHLIHYPDAPLAGRRSFHYCIFDADGNL